MDQRDALRRYDTLVAAVKAAIDAADSSGVRKMDVGNITPRVAKAADQAEVQRIILEEFERWFGPGMAGPVAEHEASAQTIWQAVLKFRS